MEVSITIPDKVLVEHIKVQIGKAVVDRIQALSQDELRLGIIEAVKHYLITSDSTLKDSHPIAQVLDKRLAEIVAGIEDEFLRNAIMQRLLDKTFTMRGV